MFTIKHGDEVVGTSELEFDDITMGVAFGEFEPDKGYPSVSQIFREFSDRQDARTLRSEDYERVKALGLRLFHGEGSELRLESLVIWDFGEGLDREIEVHFASPEDSRLYLRLTGKPEPT